MNEFLQEAYKSKKWAFVSDYYRLKYLYEQGGVYFDTDVKVIKPFPEKFFEADLVLGYSRSDLISTAVILAAPRHPFIKYLLDKYEGMEFNPEKNNNGVFTEGIKSFYPHYVLDGKQGSPSDNCFIYPEEWFEASTYNKNAGYSVHFCVGSWTNKGKLAKLIRNLLFIIKFYIKPLDYWRRKYLNYKRRKRRKRQRKQSDLS